MGVEQFSKDEKHTSSVRLWKSGQEMHIAFRMTKILLIIAGLVAIAVNLLGPGGQLERFF